MSYSKKPKMILFDVGGTIFADGRCNPCDGFEKLRLSAVNPDVTTAEKMTEYWNKYLSDVSGIKSESGITLDIPLSAVIRYVAMNTGLRFSISVAEQEELFDRYNSTRNVIGGISELLSAIGSLGIRTAVISNNMMSGESLSLAVRRWIPSAEFEFCLTSSDILFTKPSKEIFLAAASYAGVDPSDCFYCGDSVIPDVYGSSSAGMAPVLLDEKSSVQLEFRSNEKCNKYMAVNGWNALKEYLISL